MSDLAVQFTGVGKRYPHFTLEDINLRLPAGSIMGFIGANGAGKSSSGRTRRTYPGVRDEPADLAR